MAECTNATLEDLKTWSSTCLKLLQSYEWLLNCFIVDFFADDFWHQLPLAWQSALAGLTPEELASWLDPEADQPRLNRVLPLGLISLRSTLRTLSLKRRPIDGLEVLGKFVAKQTDRIQTTSSEKWRDPQEELSRASGQHKMLQHVFRRHVKPKKQHEIVRMTSIAKLTSEATGCRQMVDIGSGVGHLSRLLGYGHNFRVACVDAEDDFTASAKKFDRELVQAIEKKKRSPKEEDRIGLPDISNQPVHVTFRLTPDIHADDFEQALVKKLLDSPNDELKFGILGLHTCGDLGPILIKLFVTCPEASILQSVGCCYMRIEETFPLSRHLQAEPWTALTYQSRELACHALEMYVDRLREGHESHLRVHCHRAVLENLIEENGRPDLRHSVLKSVAKSHELPFDVYASRATAELDLTYERMRVDRERVQSQLDRWWEVVVFYSLRLAFAPVIETVLLLDRVIFLKENGIDSTLQPIFDPRLSPRNHMLLTVRTKKDGY